MLIQNQEQRAWSRVRLGLGLGAGGLRQQGIAREGTLERWGVTTGQSQLLTRLTVIQDLQYANKQEYHSYRQFGVSALSRLYLRQRRTADSLTELTVRRPPGASVRGAAGTNLRTAPRGPGSRSRLLRVYAVPRREERLTAAQRPTEHEAPGTLGPDHRTSRMSTNSRGHHPELPEQDRALPVWGGEGRAQREWGPPLEGSLSNRHSLTWSRTRRYSL